MFKARLLLGCGGGAALASPDSGGPGRPPKEAKAADGTSEPACGPQRRARQLGHPLNLPGGEGGAGWEQMRPQEVWVHSGSQCGARAPAGEGGRGHQDRWQGDRGSEGGEQRDQAGPCGSSVLTYLHQEAGSQAPPPLASGLVFAKNLINVRILWMPLLFQREGNRLRGKSQPPPLEDGVRSRLSEAQGGCSKAGEAPALEQPLGPAFQCPQPERKHSQGPGQQHSSLEQI